jgi:spore coat polysaccharide biosynthesis predicted glycosyltransferase SpsG
MDNMTIAFYTEAGSLKGMGHLVRCYTIAQEFKKNNHNVHFYLDSDINFDYKFDDLKYFKWNNVDFIQKYDVVVIDSYLASLDIYKNIANSCKLLVSIDDYGRLDYPRGLILNFAPDSKELFYANKKEGYHYLLGLDYIPIRQKIIDTISDKKEQIFIILGGMDTTNLSIDILNCINELICKK